jgi:aspartate 1-decarboxylase
MYRTMLKSAISAATVTQADLHYVGSLTLCGDLMAAADLLAGEKVDLVDLTNGARLSTYVIEGPPGSGVVGINGAAARLISPGDTVTVLAFGEYPGNQAEAVRPTVVSVDAANRVIGRCHDIAA